MLTLYRCTAQYWQGEIDVDWNGTLILTTREGSEYKFPTQGTVHRVDAAKVVAVCEPSPNVDGTPVTVTASSATTTMMPSNVPQPAATGGGQSNDSVAGSSTGATAGIVLGTVAIVALLGSLAFIFAYKWRRNGKGRFPKHHYESETE